MTELQLKVMRILWDKGEVTASEVQAGLRPTHTLAATTVSTLLARMAKRGDVAMRREGRQFFYSARIAESDITARKLTEVADLLFSGSAAAAISHLLDSTKLDSRELRALQKQIADKEAATSRLDQARNASREPLGPSAKATRPATAAASRFHSRAFGR